MNLKGKRTKLTGLIVAALYAVDTRFALNIPQEVYLLLGYLVLHFLRDGAESSSGDDRKGPDVRPPGNEAHE